MICIIVCCSVTSMCRGCHLSSDEMKTFSFRFLDAYYRDVKSMLCLELISVMLTFPLLLSLFLILKERTVRETEIQTIQRKVRKLTAILNILTNSH